MDPAERPTLKPPSKVSPPPPFVAPEMPPIPPSFERQGQVADQAFDLFCLGVTDGIRNAPKFLPPCVKLSQEDSAFFKILTLSALYDADLVKLVELLLREPERVSDHVFSVLAGKTACSERVKYILNYLHNAEPFLESFKKQGKLVECQMHVQMEEWLTSILLREEALAPVAKGIFSFLVETTSFIFQQFHNSALFCSVNEKTYIYKSLLKELFFSVLESFDDIPERAPKERLEALQRLTSELVKSAEIAAICSQTDFLPLEAIQLLHTLIIDNAHMCLIVTGRVSLPDTLEEPVRQIIHKTLHFLGRIPPSEQPKVIARVLEHLAGALK